MASFAAARSILRSASTARTTVASRIAKPKPAASPFSFPKPNKNPLSHGIFRAYERSPVELSCCVETLLPYHTATASALLTSMLSVSQRSWIWIPEDQ